MTPLKTDAAAYLCMKKMEVAGVTGTCVDECLNAGDIDFQHHTKKTIQKFNSKPRVNGNFDLYGMQINTMKKEKFSISQPYYIRTLNAMPVDATFERFSRDPALLSWLTHTRPDLACYANRASQASEETFVPAKVRELNQGVDAAYSNGANKL